MDNQNEAQYDTFAKEYTSASDLPCCQLEGQLILLALGDCTGLSILDLGGGNGIHARRAITAGAATVDVFDISSEMLLVGEAEEIRLGRQDRIRFFTADATKPLAAQQVDSTAVRPEGYDIVMVNWTFDNATSLDGLRAMWENAVVNLKPGGRLVCTQLKNIRAEYMSTGKYGNMFTNLETIPGGVKYNVECLTNPPFKWETQAMDSVYPLTQDIPRELGLVDFNEIAPQETEIVKGDMEFWGDFLKDPFFVVVMAVKS